IEPITLQFCLCSEHGEAYEWDDYTLENICNWFWQREFKPFISYDNIEEIYYLKARKIIKRYTKDKKGVLEIEFQPYTNYAYRSFQKVITVKDTREIKLNNVSNVDEEYAPVIDIECLKEGDITIRNS
ncbi:phage tail domain-containing protein, partial [Clostridioides difficile]